ncbi:hypothetical protein [Streptomyces sp. NA02950]|uniref:hypothetical protein n=1 Tax=Streptomyces sp. NA02950 TaxID=2742137 RepID=UPI0020CADDEC|nr:hypothetical protein [Streptomyces sp. NA02950]
MTTRAEQWTPPTGECPEALPAGKWWDAVRVEEPIGERALAFLGSHSGAVIQDRCNTLYWLITPGAAVSWNLRNVHVLSHAEGVATYLGVPPVRRLARPGTFWRVPFTQDWYLTDAWRLYKALAHAVLTEPDTGEGEAR